MTEKPEAGEVIKVEDIEKIEVVPADYEKFEEVKEIEIVDKMTIDTTLIEEHIDTMEKKKDVFTLFQTFEDSSSEYKMKKIRLNESDFLEFFEGLKETRVEIVAFFGEFTKCMDLAEEFIE